MFKIKCGDKYFKKIKMEHLPLKYIDENGEFNLKQYERECNWYRVHGINYEIALVNSIDEASIFDESDQVQIFQKRWFRKSYLDAELIEL